MTGYKQGKVDLAFQFSYEFVRAVPVCWLRFAVHNILSKGRQGLPYHR